MTQASELSAVVIEVGGRSSGVNRVVRPSSRAELGTLDHDDVEVVDTDLGLDALRPEWDDLYRSCPTSTPFQSWAWLRTWWGHYGSSGSLRVVLVRRSGRLVAALPLALDTRGRIGRLRLLGEGLSDHLDGLLRPGHEHEGVDGWLRGIRALPGWHLLDLREVRPEAQLWRLYDSWESFARRIEPGPACWERRAAPWDDFLGQLDRSWRKTARWSVNKAAREGIAARQVDAADAGEAAGRLLDLHLQHRRGRELSPEHTTARFRSFLTTVASRLSATGDLRIVELRDGDDMVMLDLVLICPDYVGTYLFAASPGFQERFQIMPLLMRSRVDLALASGARTVNLLRGDEAYKRRWCGDPTPNHRMVMANPPAFGVAYLGLYRVRQEVVSLKRPSSRRGGTTE